jgi:hypothetical protein
MVHDMDAGVPLHRVETIEEAVAREVAPTRF